MTQEQGKNDQPAQPENAAATTQFQTTGSDSLRLENSALKNKVLDLQSQISCLRDQHNINIKNLSLSSTVIGEWKESYEKRTQEFDQLVEKFNALVADRAEANQCVIDMQKRLSGVMHDYATFVRSPGESKSERDEDEDGMTEAEEAEMDFAIERQQLNAKISELEARILVHDERNGQLNQQIQIRDHRIHCLEMMNNELVSQNTTLVNSVKSHRETLSELRSQMHSNSPVTPNRSCYGTEDILTLLNKCGEAGKATKGNVYVRFSSNGAISIYSSAMPELTCSDETPTEAIAHLDKLIAAGREPCVSVPVPLEYLKRLAARQSIPHLFIDQFEANCAAALLNTTNNQQQGEGQ